MKLIVTKLCNEYTCWLFCWDEGQMGKVLVFFFISCSLSFEFDVGVTEGTQNEGRVGFAFFQKAVSILNDHQRLVLARP